MHQFKVIQSLGGAPRMWGMVCLEKKNPENYTKIDLKKSCHMSCFLSLCRMDEGDAMIMHPGIICIMVRLLPRLYLDDHPQVSSDEHMHFVYVTWLI